MAVTYGFGATQGEGAGVPSQVTSQPGFPAAPLFPHLALDLSVRQNIPGLKLSVGGVAGCKLGTRACASLGA